MENLLASCDILWVALNEDFSTVAEQQSKRLVDGHEHFSAQMDGKCVQVVNLVLPVDILGVDVLLLDAGQS